SLRDYSTCKRQRSLLTPGLCQPFKRDAIGDLGGCAALPFGSLENIKTGVVDAADMAHGFFPVECWSLMADQNDAACIKGVIGGIEDAAGRKRLAMARL